MAICVVGPVEAALTTGMGADEEEFRGISTKTVTIMVETIQIRQKRVKYLQLRCTVILYVLRQSLVAVKVATKLAPG